MKYYRPTELLNIAQWLVYTKNKTPYSAKTKSICDVTDINNLSDFETAYSLYNTSNKYNGVGFAFFKDNGLVFIDLDHCYINGKLTDFANYVVDLFKGNYIEVSQSGQGLHIITKGTIARAYKPSEKPIEIYNHKRYCAITFNAISANEPIYSQDAIDKLVTLLNLNNDDNKPKNSVKIHSDKTQSNATNKELPKNSVKIHSDKTIEEILANVDAAMVKKTYKVITNSKKQYDKFIKLFNGNTEDYNSHSQADQAFINIVNHFAKGDIKTIYAIWLDSQLSKRDKGKRIDYIDRMIYKAQTTHYEPKNKQ